MKPRIEMHVTRVASGGDDVAVLYNDWRARVQGPDGPVEITGRALEVVRRLADGSWRFVIDDPYARSR
jgi:ketosteroid isomerase-like protein